MPSAFDYIIQSLITFDYGFIGLIVFLVVLWFQAICMRRLQRLLRMMDAESRIALLGTDLIDGLNAHNAIGQGLLHKRRWAALTDRRLKRCLLVNRWALSLFAVALVAFVGYTLCIWLFQG